jgi:hypothetical protein
MKNDTSPTSIPDCLAFWNFQGDDSRRLTSVTASHYTLIPHNGAPAFAREGVFGPASLDLKDSLFYSIPQALCGDLNRSKGNSEVTVVAWIKRRQQAVITCEAIAGIWNETARYRQYCLFLNIRITGGQDSVSGHVSTIGGPTPGCRYCEDVSVGKTPVPFDEWATVAFSYDCQCARSYLNGSLDAWEDKNPYAYPGRLFAPETGGSDFTVGAVDRSGESGNWYRGLLGGLAVYGRALSDSEIAALSPRRIMVS